jgi:hypothetical protein
MALVVLLIGVLVGSQGGSRAGLVAAVAAAAAVIAVVIGLLHEALPSLIVSTPLGWLIAVDEEPLRLRGIMSAPNAMAMLALLPACLVAAWMMHRRSLSVWLAGSAVLAVVAVGVLLTFSRSAVLALAAVAVSYAWYIRRSAAIVMLLVAVVAAAILVPLYLEQRAGTPLAGVEGILQGFFTVGDSVRASGWAAAIRMTLDSPLIGQGFRSYVLLHAQFGDPAQSAPHNEWLRPDRGDGWPRLPGGGPHSPLAAGPRRRRGQRRRAGCLRRAPRLRHHGLVQQPVELRPAQHPRLRRPGHGSWPGPARRDLEAAQRPCC